MQPIRRLENFLRENSGPDSFIYTRSSIRALFTGMSDGAVMQLFSRATKIGLLERVCKGVYVTATANYPASKVLPYTAAILRAHSINYISLESVLCNHSVISQQMTNFITVVTTGREGMIDCGRFGTIEFVHSKLNPERTAGKLRLDTWSGMLVANLDLAMSDMKRFRRPLMSMVDRG